MESCKSLSGKVALVTGAASGIGRAVATNLAGRGATVIATDVNADGCQALAEETRQAGGDLRIVIADMLSQNWIETITADVAEVDLLANVAGILDGFAPVDEMTDALWAKVFAINVKGPMQTMRAFLPGMVKKGTGAIVNVASIAGISGTGGGAAYTSSKHALVGLTRNTAKMYFRDNIRCNAIAPGGTITGIDLTMSSERGRAAIQPYFELIPPPATADQVAASVCWLLSADASNVNGAVLSTDGGWSVL